MRTDSNKLKTFIEKTTINGNIPSGVLHIKDGTGTMNLKQTDNTIMTLAALNGLPKDVEMSIGIKDTKLLLKILRKFSGDIELKLNENILSIYDKETQFDIVVAEEQYIDNRIPEEIFGKISNFKYETSVKMLSKPFKDILDLMSVVNSETITINVKDKKLNLLTGNKSFDSAQKTYPLDYKDMNVMFWTPFVNIISVLGEKIEFSGDTDKPAIIKEVSDYYNVTYVVAPRIDEA